MKKKVKVTKRKENKLKTRGKKRGNPLLYGYSPQIAEQFLEDAKAFALGNLMLSWFKLVDTSRKMVEREKKEKQKKRFTVVEGGKKK